MSTVTTDVINIGFAIILLLINGFFVAAEFALVKIRPSRLDEQVEKNQRFAATARWLAQRMDASLSAPLRMNSTPNRWRLNPMALAGSLSPAELELLRSTDNSSSTSTVSRPRRCPAC